MTQQYSGLAAGLAAEHAAIFAYGAAGAHLSGDLAGAVSDAQTAHRDRRDRMSTYLPDADQPPAEPGYQLPFDVTDESAAIELITEVERSTARVWRAAIAETSGADRRVAAEALADCAVTAARWRQAIGEPATVPYPGRDSDD